MGGPERAQFEPGAKGEKLSLAEQFPSALVGEVDTETDGRFRVVQAFEFIVDPADRERRAVVLGFCMQAAAMGYEIALPPVTLPGVGFRDQAGERPLSAIYFFVTTPDVASSATRPTGQSA